MDAFRESKSRLRSIYSCFVLPKLELANSSFTGRGEAFVSETGRRAKPQLTFRRKGDKKGPCNISYETDIYFSSDKLALCSTFSHLI